MAQTYKFGSGTWATKKGSTLAYSDTNNAFKPLPFSFERNSIGTRVNKEGLIEVVGNDIPRIDYTDSTDGVLLLENSATNLITQSEDFSDAAWLKGGSSVVGGFSAPNGTNNAYKLVEDTSTSTHYLQEFISQADGSTNTISLFAKKAERNHITIYCGGAFTDSSTFNLNNGTSVNNGNSTSKIELISNGWYKCSVTSINKSRDVYIMLNNGDVGTSGVVYQGDETSGVYIWGAMLEQNSVASSYIPTNGSTVQRAPETCSESGNSEVFNDSQGVLFADLNYENIQSDWTGFGLTDGNDPSNRIVFATQLNTKNFKIYLQSGGTVVWNPNVVLNQINQYQKIAVKYKANDVSLWLNGFEVVSDNTVSIMPTGLDRLGFFGYSNLEPFYGNTKEIAYYDEILTDLELETLTSYRSLNEMVTELNLNAL